MASIKEIQKGDLCEYVGEFKSSVWVLPIDYRNEKARFFVEKNDLFALMKFQQIDATKGTEQKVYLCEGLFLKNHLVGGFVCFEDEIQLKK